MKIQLNNGIELSISQIESLKPVTGNTTLVGFRTGNRIRSEYAICEMNYHELCDAIRSSAGSPESYGEYNGGSDYEHSHRIRLIRENDNSAHGVLCPLCGGVFQIYHSQRCNCKTAKPFGGDFKISDKVISLTCQPVYICKESQDAHPSLRAIKQKKYKLTFIEKTISNIFISDGSVFGIMNYKGSTIPVSSILPSDIDNIDQFQKIPQRFIWEIQSGNNLLTPKKDN